jgi:hypothetical protein
MRRWLTQFLIDQLTKPLGQYERRGWNDMEALQRHVHKGDVVLVEGEQRISAIIRYLTQSSWSHAAIYVGDELLLRGEELRAETLACFGEDGQHMVVEALLDGVVASPLSKYQHLNVRVCRPHNLKPTDMKTVLDQAVRSLGWRYDLRNIVDLMRYLLPFGVHPARFRLKSGSLGSGAAGEVICTSHLGQIFQSVGFPVAPQIEFPDGEAFPPTRPRGLWGLLRPRDHIYYSGLYRRRHPTLLTPRDFDLSPWFEVIKFNAIADRRFDYGRIRWVDEAAPAAVQAPPPEEPVGPTRVALSGGQRR